MYVFWPPDMTIYVPLGVKHPSIYLSICFVLFNALTPTPPTPCTYLFSVLLFFNKLLLAVSNISPHYTPDLEPRRRGHFCDVGTSVLVL